MKIKLIILSVLGVLALTSCDDFLDEQPISALSEDDFYNDGDDVSYALNGAYSLVRNAYYNEFLVTEQRTENSTLAVPEGEYEQLDEGSEDASNTLVETFWNTQYDVINSANLVIENIEIATEDEGKSRMYAEALFLRALMHFNLARSFSEFYYMESTVSYEEALLLTTVTSSDVYSDIIADLEAALPDLLSQDDTDVGRATKAAAQVLLADVLITSGDNASALTVLKSLIEDNDTDSIYALESDFSTIFTDETNDEIVFSVGYISGSEELGQEFSQEFTSGGFGTGINIPTTDLLSAFGAVDTNYATYGTDTRLAVTVKEDNNLVERMNGKYGENIEYSGKDWIVYRYADALLMYVEASLSAGTTTDSDALKYYNEVINRADPTASAVTSVSTDDLLLQRRLEFAGENKYLYDLRRLGTGAYGKLDLPDSEDRIRN